MPINLWHLHHVMMMRYEVLISVSRCYPSARGRLPTRYSPVRRFPSTESTEASSVDFSLDLHVLSTPPAFILSQNRTLHKKTMRKAKNRLSQNKIDDRLIRKGDSHENPDPHQPPSRTPPQDNQKPHTEAGTGLAIIDYKRSSTDTLLSSQTTTTHPTKPTPRRKPAGERQQENNIHHHPHPRNPTTTKHPTNPRKTNQTPACRKHHPTTPNQHQHTTACRVPAIHICYPQPSLKRIPVTYTHIWCR